ncbi:MAG: hypothetical protein AAGD35_14050 [Actinomycetota bacterium]
MTDRIVKQASEVKLIVFACEAGAGSSLMGANQLKKLAKKAKLDATVMHAPVQQIPDEVDVVVTHQSLAAQARTKVPDAAIVTYMLFLNDPNVKGLVEKLKNGDPIESAV